MSTSEVALSVEDMEKVMASIEAGEGAGVPVAPVNTASLAPSIPNAAVVTEATPVASAASPLALREFVNPEQLKKDVEFNPNDLDNAVQMHAGLFVHYSNLARLARRQWERMKAAFEIMESRLDSIHRERLKSEGAKTTEAMIANAVKADPRWWAAQQRLIDAKAIYDLANDAREAFSQRKDMIVQISVDRRRERDGQLRIMDQQQQQDARANAMQHATAAGANAEALRTQ